MESTAQIPKFLHLANRDHESKSTGSFSGVFHHETFDEPASAHTRWWSCSTESVIQTVLFFIPGNPGLIDFYNNFLSVLHSQFKDQGLAILAHAHLGHSPHLDKSEQTRLVHQVVACIEVLDTIKSTWPEAKIILVGHSVGSWIATQVLKDRLNSVGAAFLLFPTISHIADTPNGRMLSWLFCPIVSSAVSKLSILLRPFVSPVASLLYSSWPEHQRMVVRSMLRSPSVIQACLSMAHDEMRTNTTPDASFLKEQSRKLWLYYAEKDNWVGKEKAVILNILGEDSHVRVMHCQHGVPHAFCILHGDIIADQVAKWIKEVGVLDGES